MKKVGFLTVLAFCVALLSGANALAEVPEFNLTIKDHIFSPAELVVPAGKKVKIIIDNQDETPEEFESHDLHREKIISGKSKGIVFVGPLEPGEYKYFGEFNEKTAKGIIKAE